MKPLTMLRTAVGSSVAAGFVRELQERGVRVVGVDADPNAVGKHLCDAFYTVPWGRDPAFIPALLDICTKEKSATIISGPEEETLALATNRQAFEKIGVRIYLSGVKEIQTMQDKAAFAEYIAQFGLQSPRSFKEPSELKVPYIVKPRMGRGSAGVRVVRNTVEDSTFKPDQIYQEYIEGTEYSVDCFFDPTHQPLLLTPRVRIKTDSGVSIVSKTVRHASAEKEICALAAHMSLVGPVCIQFIEREGKRFYTDCNHRFGGASILSVKSCVRFMPNFLALCGGLEYNKNELDFTEGLIMKRYYAEIYAQE